MEKINKQNIKREDFKHNFLKTIIIRIDFGGVSESELEDIIPKIKASCLRGDTAHLI